MGLTENYKQELIDFNIKTPENSESKEFELKLKDFSLLKWLFKRVLIIIILFLILSRLLVSLKFQFTIE